MITFLFWNIAKRPLSQTISALVSENNVDILILAENEIPVAELLDLLNPPANVRFNFVAPPIPIAGSKVDIFFGFDPAFLQPQTDTRRATFRRVLLPGRQEFLLCGVHFQSRYVWEETDQAHESVEFNRIIRDAENSAGHSRTVVVGDLNMNPFSQGLTAANGFNAVMTRQIALTKNRTVADREHPFFFNPMWTLFGDGEVRPGGTFYMQPPGYNSLYWNMLDQVLIRPQLIPHFDLSSLKILAEYQGGRLVAENGRPSMSDHLPILFKLNL